MVLGQDRSKLGFETDLGFRHLLSQFIVHQHEEFEDPKWEIEIRKSKKDRQHNGQKKKDKRTNNDLQNMHIKLKIE